MGKYIIKRLLLLIPTLFLVCLIVFSLMRCLPGDAVDALMYRLQTTGNTSATRETAEVMLGMDKPAVVQFFTWFKDVLHGDLGNCFFDNSTVQGVIAHNIVPSLELGIITLIITVFIAVPLGAFCAARQDSISDYAIRTISLILMSLPVFWIATIVLIYPAIYFHWAPSTEYVGFFEAPMQNLKMFLVPALLGAVTNCGMQLRYVRTVTLETMRMDYVRTARAKGVKGYVVLFRHSLRNAMIPVITLIGGCVSALIGGSVILENLYSIPGIGSTVVNALNNRDYPLVQGCILVFSLFAMIVNVIVDVCYKVVDPRVNLE